MLADDVVADLDSPPFDKALVDGFAVRSLDLADPSRRLDVGESIMAGQTPSRRLGSVRLRCDDDGRSGSARVATRS